MKQVSFLGLVSKQVIAQFAKSELTIAAAKVAEDKVVQRAVDTMVLAYDTAVSAKGIPKAQWAALRAPKAAHKVEVSEMFAAIPSITDATRRNLATAFWVAFESGEPFNRSAVKDKSLAKTEAKPKTGKVESTDRAALNQTLSKGLKQMRLLGLLEFAAVAFDMYDDRLDGFKEIE